MSGFWSIEKVENWESLWIDQTAGSLPMLVPTRELPDGRSQILDPVTGPLIWTLPFIDVEEITASNLKETFIRTRMLELADGPLLTRGTEKVHLTLDDLRRRIGLRVGSDLPPRPFDERLLSNAENSCQKGVGSGERLNIGIVNKSMTTSRIKLY